MLHNLRKYSNVKIIVKLHSTIERKCPYRLLMLVTESNKTAEMLSKIQRIKTTSNTFPAEVSASKITDLTFSFSSLTQLTPLTRVNSNRLGQANL